MIKKLVGLALFQTLVYLLYIAPGKIMGGTAPVIDPAFKLYSNPLPHVLILTAIVVGVATLALGLAIVAHIRPIEEDEIFSLALLGWDYKLPQSLKEASFRLAKGRFDRDSRVREHCSPLVQEATCQGDMQ